jgi:mono/diheme cytochrome c family protein
MRPSIVLLTASALAALLVCGVQAQQSKVQNSPRAPSANAASSAGEKRFRTNCGRCHNPPEDISPREARAVVRQMRVRAMLTAEDERLILAYLAP